MPNQISFVINLEPNFFGIGQKFDSEIETVEKKYKSLLGISTPSEESQSLNFTYFRFDNV